MRADREIRAIRVDGDIAYIPLTQGKEAIIDAADVPLVSRRNWHAVLNRNVYYARSCGNRVRGTNRVMVPLHRVLLDAPAHMHVDHIDGDGLNCRRSNLRLATQAENTRNQRLSRANTSGRKGVSLDKRYGTWGAKIKHDGRLYHLGTYSNIDDAERAYLEASIRLHGPFSAAAPDANSKNQNPKDQT